MLSGAQCNGLYESCKCPPKYSYTCSYPLQGSSSECGGKYMSCKCPDSFSTCDDNPDPSAIACREENGVVKYSACHTSVTETCADYGYLTYVPVGQKCKQVKVGNSYCYKDCGYN
jgi:hypothetical protein